MQIRIEIFTYLVWLADGNCEVSSTFTMFGVDDSIATCKAFFMFNATRMGKLIFDLCDFYKLVAHFTTQLVWTITVIVSF